MRAARESHAWGGRIALARGGGKRVVSPEDVMAMSRLPISQAPAIYKPGQRNVSQVGHELARRAQDTLKRLGATRGRVDSETSKPHIDEAIAQALSHEAEHALAGHGNAANWYKEKVEEAVRLAALNHPEILTDPHARSAWAAALAITSQGEVVHRNAELADWAYQRFKDNGGRFNIDDVAAKDGPAMVGNFKKYDKLIEHVGHGGAHEYLNMPMKAGDLREDGFGMPSGMGVDTDTHGSAMFGPKIGGGFYQNLMGNYHPVTQDLWFMRTFGRLTGTLMDTVKTEEGRQKVWDRYKNALQAEGIKVPGTKAGLEALSKQHFKEWETKFRRYRPQYDAGAFRKGELDNASQRVQEMLHGVQQDPGSGADRAWRTGIVHRARQLLKERTGHDLTPADFQATIWYPEKDLWRHMGSTGGAKGEESNNVDYSQAFQRIARQRGHSDADIQQALQRPLDPDERPVAQAGANSPRVLAGRPGPAAEAPVGGGIGGGGPPGGGAPAQEAPPPGLAEGLAYGGRARRADGGEVKPAKLLRDNPGGDWLKYKREDSEEAGANQWGAPKRLGAVTGSYSRNVMLPVDLLSTIPGMRGEQQNVRQKDLDWLTEHMGRTGRLPELEGRGEEAPFVAVDHHGRPWVSEGNHRIMAAKALGWKAMPTELRYFNGGEREEGPLSPANVAQHDATHMRGPEPQSVTGAEPEGFADGGPTHPKLFHSNLHGHRLHTGPIHSHVAGRTDHLPIHVPSGSYVLPADVVSSHGEGNTIAGFKVMRRVFGGTPYGQHGGPYGQGSGPYGEALQNQSRGGRATDHGDDGVPIVAAGGEYVLSPAQVRAAGNGDADVGCRVLDGFVKASRAKHIQTLKKLPGPAKD